MAALAPSDRRQIILSDRTLRDGSSLEHIRIAADLGYDGVALRVAPTADGRPYLVPGGRRLFEARRALRDSGLTVHQVETARLHPASRPDDFAGHLEAAEVLDAPYLLTVIDDADPDRAADLFVGLAEAARARGVRLALEFMAYIGVGSLEAARRILDAPGAEDAVLLIDALHFFRSGASAEDISAIAAERLACLQICDAPAVAPRDLREEARDNRLLPGRGELPLIPLLRAMPPQAAIAVEAPSLALLAELGDYGVSVLALDTTRTLIAAAAADPIDGDAPSADVSDTDRA